MTIGRLCTVAIVIVVAVLAGCHTNNTSEVSIFAAASLIDVLGEIENAFEEENPLIDVVISFAGSSTISKQVVAGASPDLIVTADSVWMDFLATRVQLQQQVKLPIENQIVAVGTLDRARRIALGDPSHVPVGRYAKNLLECRHEWEKISRRVVPMLDTRAAVSAFRRGHADAAIAYLSDLHGLNLRTMPLATAECKQRVGYQLGVLAKGEGNIAMTFVEFMVDPTRRAIWDSFGFGVSTAG